MGNPVTHKAISLVSALFTLIEARFFCQDCLGVCSIDDSTSVNDRHGYLGRARPDKIFNVYASGFSRYAAWRLAVLPPPLDEDHVGQAPCQPGPYRHAP